MASSYLDEYLIRLGFSVDTVGYAKFASALRDASSLVNNEYLSIAKTIAGVGAGIIGGFAAIGTAALKIADDVANADQEYRLLALHMYTSVPVARQLKVALDALGQPLENVMWDPELAKRFHQLVEDQRALTKELGPDFEGQMLKIRDVRFEFTRLGVEVKYLGMLLVQDLARAFGTDLDGLLLKLRQFNSWFIANLPQIASWIATNLKPILVDTKNVLLATWEVVKQLVVDFTNFVGLLSGDKSIVGETANFKNFTKAVLESVDAVAKFIIGILKVGTNIGLMFDAAQQALAGNFSAALSDLRKMQSIQISPVTPMAGLVGAGPGLATQENVQSAIVAQAKAAGISPELALAVAKVESNYRQFDSSGKVLTSNAPGSHAMGIFQLQPGTAKQLGVDPTDVGGNITGGVDYLKYLLMSSGGNVRGALEHYYGSKNAAENQAYAQKVMKVEAGLHIDTVNINVPNGSMSPDALRGAVSRGLNDAQQQRIQRNLGEFNQYSWSY